MRWTWIIALLMALNAILCVLLVSDAYAAVGEIGKVKGSGAIE